MNNTNSQIQQEILTTLALHAGETTSKLYSDFYKKQNDISIVLISARELFSEFLGNRKSEEIMSKILKNIT